MRNLINIVSCILIGTLMFIMGEDKAAQDFKELVAAKCQRMQYLKLDTISYKCLPSHKDAHDFND